MDGWYHGRSWKCSSGRLSFFRSGERLIFGVYNLYLTNRPRHFLTFFLWTDLAAMRSNEKLWDFTVRAWRDRERHRPASATGADVYLADSGTQTRRVISAFPIQSFQSIWGIQAIPETNWVSSKNIAHIDFIQGLIDPCWPYRRIEFH